MSEKTDKTKSESEVLKKLQKGIDREHTGGECMARIIRLERVVEKLAKNSLDELYPAEEEEKAVKAEGESQTAFLRRTKKD